MPASEFFGWQAYFDIYEFTQERQDRHAAMISVTIANHLGRLFALNAGKRFYNPISIETFLPDYLGERNKPVVVEKSLEQQKLEWAIFKEKYQAAQGKIQ